MADRDNELVEDNDNGLELVGSNNNLEEDTDNGLEIANPNNDLEIAGTDSDQIFTETKLNIPDKEESSTSEECNSVMFDYHKLGYVEMMYIEMSRQNIRIGEIGEKASEQVSDVVSKLESLGSIVDVGVSDCASKLANKITERTRTIQKSMETQINAHIELNSRLENKLDYLNDLIDTLFDEDGQQIAYKSKDGTEYTSMSYQELLTMYVDYKNQREIYDNYNENEEKGFVLTTDNQTYELSDEDFELICAIVAAESDKSLDDALAVITTILNRCEADNWVRSHGSDPVAQATAPNQFVVYQEETYKKYLGDNCPDTVKQAVKDALNGVRNHDYLSFRSNGSTGYSDNMITSTGNRYN